MSHETVSASRHRSEKHRPQRKEGIKRLHSRLTLVAGWEDLRTVPDMAMKNKIPMSM
jgi:hypothetical protein